ncbi:MAG: hypothetical protein QNJ20_03495 [Paracoccaceae bacterium]|nr:hypothetical protein [Paracoccaceae bacterium]
MRKIIPIAASLAILGALGAPLQGSTEDDVFAFIPDGGRTLLEHLMEHGLSETLASNVSTEQKGVEDWAALLNAEAGEAELDEWQLDTLAHYLAWNAPIDLSGELPRDGRDMTLSLCQSCHIVTVVVTQDRTREAWLGTMNSPSHVEIETTAAERDALADYLVINGGIPIDLVPPALRAGGASY